MLWLLQGLINIGGHSSLTWHAAVQFASSRTGYLHTWPEVNWLWSHNSVGRFDCQICEMAMLARFQIQITMASAPGDHRDRWQVKPDMLWSVPLACKCRWHDHTFRRNMNGAYKRNWAGLHDSPRTAPSARAKSCTYLRWFARPGRMPAEPYFELPISLSKLRRLMQSRLGSHDLPIEQGRMARPIFPRYLRRCALCSRHALGDERHFMLECPQYDDIRAHYADLLQDARDSMRNLMWHQNQKAYSYEDESAFMSEVAMTKSDRALLAQWTS